MTERTITEGDDGATIAAALGDVIELHLEENPTTGYRWTREDLGPGLSLERDVFHVAGTPLVPGAGGVHEWSFRVTEPGPHPLRMRLWQEWEGDSSVLRHFGVDVVTD